MADNSSLPREALLLKCLNMTTVEEDTVAVVAIRQANKILAEAGWSWEKLLSAKITVIADPFANIPAPPPPARAEPPMRSAPSPSPPLRSAPPHSINPVDANLIRRRAAAQAATQQPPPSSKPYSTQPNRYGGSCYCCGSSVDSGAGFIFKPSVYNPRALDKWEIICGPCNKNKATIFPSKTQPSRKSKPIHASINPDLNSL